MILILLWTVGQYYINVSKTIAVITTTFIPTNYVSIFHCLVTKPSIDSQESIEEQISSKNSQGEGQPQEEIDEEDDDTAFNSSSKKLDKTFSVTIQSEGVQMNLFWNVFAGLISFFSNCNAAFTN